MIDALSPVLVANRGEIALRVMRTCRRLGLRTVAVYSDADARAPHVSAADAAVHIGAAPAVESYLNQAHILAGARQAGARSVHPGYGFLAENAEFAQNVIDAGLVWIGPPPAAMRAVGDKARAKALAERHGVPLLPGYHGEDQSPSTLRAQADRIGYPALLKASAGGGGRGMRVVESPAEFADALEAARREARAAFGDDRVLLERYVARPRHIEVQVLGDTHGALIHLGERECSIQRRHQKLIEESPSPAVDGPLRQRMCDAALRLCRAAGYSNAGTVEFLLDEGGDFAFLEVNARLQVEHPVTEAVTGLDLVELQLRVAAGEPLPLSQADVRPEGHAIEARVIAEDALAGFLPSSGRIERFHIPGRVRIDTWVTDGTEVSPFYDSLLAKVVAHAASRQSAIDTLGDALKFSTLTGIRHNLDLLLATLETPAFGAGDLDTRFIDVHGLIQELNSVAPEALVAAAAFDHTGAGISDPWQAHTAWRLGRVAQPSVWTRAGREHSVRMSARLDGPGLDIRVGDRDYAVHQVDARHMSVDGRTVLLDGRDALRVATFEGRAYRLERASPVSVVRGRQQITTSGGLSAPMPGRVVKIAVESGQAVNQNQPLVVLEAMKMEHVVEAPHAGVVTDICVAVGDQVPAGAPLLTLGSEPA